MGKSTNYMSILKTVGMNTLEHRTFRKISDIFFKYFKENGPRYIANLFKPQVTPYNLRSSGLKVEQNSYCSKFFRGLYTYTVPRIWNQPPSIVKNTPNNVSSFHRH